MDIKHINISILNDLNKQYVLAKMKRVVQLCLLDVNFKQHKLQTCDYIIYCTWNDVAIGICTIDIKMNHKNICTYFEITTLGTIQSVDYMTKNELTRLLNVRYMINKQNLLYMVNNCFLPVLKNVQIGFQILQYAENIAKSLNIYIITVYSLTTTISYYWKNNFRFYDCNNMLDDDTNLTARIFIQQYKHAYKKAPEQYKSGAKLLNMIYSNKYHNHIFTSYDNKIHRLQLIGKYGVRMQKHINVI